MRHPPLALHRPGHRTSPTLKPGEAPHALPATYRRADPYRALFERNQAVQLLIDPDTSAIVDANPAACAFYGFGRRQLRSLYATDLSLRLADQVLEDIQQANILQSSFVRSRHRLASGATRDVEIMMNSVEVRGRSLLHAIIMDVTERARSERLLHLQYDLNTTLAATADLPQALGQTLEAALHIEGVDCGGIYLPDPDTGILNLAVHNGLSPQFVEHASHYPPASPQAQAVHAGMSAQFRQGVDALPDFVAQEGLRTYLAMPVLYEGRLLCVLNVASRTVDEFLPPVQLALQAVARGAGSALARIQAQSALRDKEEELRLALAGADLGIWLRRVATGALTFNARWAEMLGYAPDELEPHFRTVQRLIHPDDLPLLTAALDAHLQGATPSYECAYRMRHKAGHWIWVQARGRVIERDAAGQPIRIGGTNLDVTRRHEAEALLQQQAAALSRAQEEILRQNSLLAAPPKR